MTFTRAMGWLWLGHGAAAAAAFASLAYAVGALAIQPHVSRDQLAILGIFLGGMGMVEAAALAIFAVKLGRFALGRAPGGALALLAGAVIIQVLPTAFAYLITFDAVAPVEPLAQCLQGRCLERPAQAVIFLEGALALVTLGWLAALARVRP